MHRQRSASWTQGDNKFAAKGQVALVELLRIHPTRKTVLFLAKQESKDYNDIVSSSNRLAKTMKRHKELIPWTPSVTFFNASNWNNKKAIDQILIVPEHENTSPDPTEHMWNMIPRDVRTGACVIQDLTISQRRAKCMQPLILQFYGFNKSQHLEKAMVIAKDCGYHPQHIIFSRSSFGINTWDRDNRSQLRYAMRTAFYLDIPHREVQPHGITFNNCHHLVYPHDQWREFRFMHPLTGIGLITTNRATPTTARNTQQYLSNLMHAATPDGGLRYLAISNFGPTMEHVAAKTAMTSLAQWLRRTKPTTQYGIQTIAWEDFKQRSSGRVREQALQYGFYLRFHEQAHEFALCPQWIGYEIRQILSEINSEIISDLGVNALQDTWKHRRVDRVNKEWISLSFLSYRADTVCLVFNYCRKFDRQEQEDFYKIGWKAALKPHC